MKIFDKEFGYGEICRASHRNQRYDIAPHIHQFSEIIYVFNGTIHINVDGIEYILTTGDAAVITPFRIHSVNSIGVAEFWICVFSVNCVPDHISESDFFQDRTSSVFRPSEVLTAYIRDMLARYPHPIYLSDCVVPRRIKSVLYSVFCEYIDAVPEVTETKKRDVLSSVILYVNEHYLEDINLSSVGKALGYNVKYLSQALGAIPDMNFPTLLNSLRIDHAKSLLLSSDFKIIDIAYECAFKNEQSFYRAFKKITGMTPIDYKRRNQAKKKR
ncbi:MAG: helix-turn-helix domain-containing protein [Ruminococcaceae bacterium]|nr:helix-turn-helix domain-containing protein [Oscillospiraceae bacterium]